MYICALCVWCLVPAESRRGCKYVSYELKGTSVYFVTFGLSSFLGEFFIRELSSTQLTSPLYFMLSILEPPLLAAEP